jgi:SAM-dependent methyltransferase
MDAADWDACHGRNEIVWGEPPNAVVVEHVAMLPPARALDLACGAGRDTLWLATRGWRVDALDWSQVAIDKARTVAVRLPRSVRERVAWHRGDVTGLAEVGLRSPFDLIVMCFLQLPPAQRRTLLHEAAARLAPGGMLLVIGHDSTNPTEGHNGPLDPEILFTPADIMMDLDGVLDIEVADRHLRPTEAGDAFDAVVVARRGLPAERATDAR